MRTGQNKRMRGRNRKSHNPLTRVYESNGPDVKIRGTASHVAEKYLQLARDAQSSGDPVAAENYFQHAEHYFRLIAAAQEQFRQSPQFYRPEGATDSREDSFDDEEDTTPSMAGDQPAFGTRDPQPYIPRDAQFFPPREQSYGRPQQQSGPANGGDEEAVDRLPSFITGGGQPQQAQPQGQGQPHQAHGQNGFEGQQQGDRFPLHRRRRRHRGPRSDMGAPSGPEGSEETGPRE